MRSLRDLFLYITFMNLCLVYEWTPIFIHFLEMTQSTAHLCRKEESQVHPYWTPGHGSASLAQIIFAV